MSCKPTFKLIPLILCIGYIFLISTECARAQPVLKERNRTKDFGKSLKSFEKKGKDKTKDAQKSVVTGDEETLQVKTDLVVNDVSVVNQKGNLVVGLGKNDFIVKEDDVEQEISLFSFGENAKIPRSIVLIYDYSTSLRPYINNSTEAAKALIDKLGPSDRIAIVTDDVKLVVDFTKDKTLLKNKLDALNKNTLRWRGGLSRQYSALLAVLKEMFDDEDVRPMVILQSDGDEIPGLKRGAGEYPMSVELRSTFRKAGGERAFSYGDLMAAVEKSRATIYSIIPGIRLLNLPEAEQTKRVEIMLGEINMIPGFTIQNSVRNSDKKRLSMYREQFVAGQNSMFEIAKLSGGYTDYIERPEDAEAVYSTMLTIIGNRYFIGYYPLNEIRDGKPRSVKIQVRGHPEYTVTGRRSYIAAE